MKIDFLESLGHASGIWIRCLQPKKLPSEIAERLGMTFISEDGKLVRLPISGYLDRSGTFTRHYSSGRTEVITDGWGYLQSLNEQGYGIFFAPHHGGLKSHEITHGAVLFHESDRVSLDEQQQEIDRISKEFGEPTAVVKTRKSLHAYWRCADRIPVDQLGTYQRRWLQYSNCDDHSLCDPAQLMRLPGFDHVSWNPDTKDLERVKCELIHLSEAVYSIDQFDEVIPQLDLEQWTARETVFDISDQTASDIRSYAPYLDGCNPSGRSDWITAKCPAHNGDSDDSLHINPESGAFICHAGCSPSAIYQAAKAKAVANGYRLPNEGEPDAAQDEDFEDSSDAIDQLEVLKKISK